MKKEEFKVKANQIIDDVSAKINLLKAKKDTAQGDAKAMYAESIKDLESKKTDLLAKYAKLETASEEKWEEVKNAFSSASDSFKEGWLKIKSQF
jgi:malate synthase